MQVQKETVTPRKSMEWLKRNVCNRPLSKKWVDGIAEAMTDGVFRFNGDTIRFNGNGDLIDGQHRLTACVQSGKPFEAYIVRGLEHDAFDTIDQGRKRTTADVFARQGYKHYTRLAAAVRWLWLYENFLSLGSSGQPRPIRSDEANDILEKHPAIHAAVEKSSTLARAKLINPGLLSFLIYFTSQKEEEKAVAFWSGVVESSGLKKDTPGYLLNKRLISNLGSQAKLHETVIAALAIKSWNSFRSGKPCGTLKWQSDEEFPTITL